MTLELQSLPLLLLLFMLLLLLLLLHSRRFFSAYHPSRCWPDQSASLRSFVALAPSLIPCSRCIWQSLGAMIGLCTITCWLHWEEAWRGFSVFLWGFFFCGDLVRQVALERPWQGRCVTILSFGKIRLSGKETNSGKLGGEEPRFLSLSLHCSLTWNGFSRVFCVLAYGLQQKSKAAQQAPTALNLES